MRVGRVGGIEDLDELGPRHRSCNVRAVLSGVCVDVWTNAVCAVSNCRVERCKVEIEIGDWNRNRGSV